MCAKNQEPLKQSLMQKEKVWIWDRYCLVWVFRGSSLKNLSWYLKSVKRMKSYFRTKNTLLGIFWMELEKAVTIFGMD